MKITSRPFTEGDGKALNELYFTVTGRHRSEADFSWQWLDAPAGQGEMWIIEATDAAGETHVVGHHGLMPLAFSQGDQTFIVGKTENTMLHPDFRGKILYHAYEKRFLSEYRDRFDLLFSTTGPAAALRQRKALGYDGSRHWLRYDLGLVPAALPRLLLAKAELGRVAQRGTHYKIAVQVLKLISFAVDAVQAWIPGRKNRPDELRAYDDGAAKSCDFFDAFWKQAAPQYPLTPRREKCDLAWRFWDNPNVSYITLVHRDGYAILTKRHKYFYRIDDIVVNPYDEAGFQSMLRMVGDWCLAKGAVAMSFVTTDDPSSPSTYVENSGLRILDMRRFQESDDKDDRPTMLRRATDRGESDGASVDDWFVTSFVTEGRS